MYETCYKVVLIMHMEWFDWSFGNASTDNLLSRIIEQTLQNKTAGSIIY